MASELAQKRHLQDEIKYKLDQHKDWLQQMQGENMDDDNEEHLNNVHKMPDTHCVQPHGNKKRWDQLYELNKLQKETREFMRQAMAEEMEEDPECTFHPKISEKSYHMVSKNRPNFQERNQIWLDQKEMKIKALGMTNEDKGLLHCTFQPQIHDHTQGIYHPQRPGIQNYNGVNKFLQRQVAAREEKSRKETALNTRATNNPNKITIPNPPRFTEQHQGGGQGKGNYNSNGGAQKKKPTKLEQIYNDPNNIYISNVPFGDAVKILHECLNGFEIDLE